MQITINDIKLAGHCARGAKNWFNVQGLDFRTFLKNGIPVEEFTASGDAQGIQVVERKIARELASVGVTNIPTDWQTALTLWREVTAHG